MALTDGQGRQIDYLRISLTDKCNLRCRYCMPPQGISLMEHEQILTLEELLRLTSLMTGMGIARVRLTGGEPFVRKNMMSLLRELTGLPSPPKIAITTNATLLAPYIDELSRLGIRDINISLDSLRRDGYFLMTGKDKLDGVLDSIRLALDAGMNIKINCVPVEGINDEDIMAITSLAKDEAIAVRFIELMPIGCASALKGISSGQIRRALEQVYGQALEVASSSDVRGPAGYITFEGFRGKIGFIGSMTSHFCDKCNRLRLTCDGKLKTCLYAAPTLDLKKMIRSGCTDDEIRQAIEKEVKQKPADRFRATEKGDSRNMVQIGG